MTDLTEKWKNGSLTDGYYYIKNPSDYKFILWYDEKLNHIIKGNKWEVLEEVPTYKLWKDICEGYEISQRKRREYKDLIEKTYKLLCKGGDKTASKWSNEYDKIIEEMKKVIE